MLEQKIEDLTRAVETLTATLAAMSLAPAAAATAPVAKVAPAQEQPATTDETPAPSGPSEQDLKDLTLSKSRDGHKDAIRDKLTSFGAKKLGDLKSVQAAEFYDWLKTLGSN